MNDASCALRLALCEERRGQDRGKRDDGELDDLERQCERVDEPGEQGDGRYQEDGDPRALEASAISAASLIRPR